MYDSSELFYDVFKISNLESYSFFNSEMFPSWLVMAHNPAHDLFSIGNFLCRVRNVDRCDTS